MKAGNILKILAAAALLVFFMQPFFTWFAADDFCYMHRVQREGIFGRMWHEYMTWDGRSISITYPVCRAGLYTGKHWVGPLIGSVLLFAISLISLAISGNRSANKTDNFFRATLLTSVLWLACFNIASQTLYWTTGIGYNVDLLLLLGAYGLFLFWKDKPLFYAAGFPVFFYAGTCSPNGTLALLLLIGMHWLNDFFILKNVNWKRYLYAAALVVTALLVVVLAPGNANRLVGMDKANLTHIWTIYFNLKRVFSNLYAFNTPVLWMLMSIGVLGASIAFRQRKNAESLGMFQSVIAALFAHRFLLAAVFTFVFFMAFPGLHSPRTNLHFIVFGVLYALDNLKSLGFSGNPAMQKVFSGLSAAALLLFLFLGLSQAFDARYVKGQIAERNSRLRGMEGQSVVLGQDDIVRPPMTRRFEDVSPDSTYWLNQCVAETYKLRSIVLIPAKDTAYHPVMLQ